jgi:cytidylate kinase
MFRVVTVGREFGSGGAAIARRVADRLGWRLLDEALVRDIAARAKIDADLARKYDEAVDSWLHRIGRASLWQGAFEAVASVKESDFLDAVTMARLAATLIVQAHAQGDCVIVGRGGQCVLQNRPDVFHVYIYAPWAEKVARVRARDPELEDPEEYIRSVDRRRAEYVRQNYGCTWADPHLYHLLISSQLGEETVASLIVAAVNAPSGR